MNVFDLVASLFLDKESFDKGLSESEKDAQSFGDKLKSGLGTAAKVGGAAVAAVGTAAVAAGTALVKGAAETAAYGDNIDKMSQKMGISAEAFQEWDFILQHSGTDVSALQASMKTLTSAAESNADAFAELGISQEQLAAMSPEETFSAVITGLQGMQDQEKRTELATKLLGRGAMEMGALLNTSAEETQAMREQVHELGGVMSDEAVKASAAYQDSLQNMNTAIDGIKRSFLEDMLPGITEAMDGITMLFTGDSEEGLALISQGIDDLATSLSEKLPVFAEVAADIINSIGTAIIDNLPVIIDAAVNIVIKLAQGLIDNLPKLVQAAATIITQLAGAISKNIPVLLPAIIDCVIAIAKAIVENAPMIMQAGFELFIALIKELPRAALEIIKGVGDLLNSIFRVIGNAWDRMKEIGSNLIKGLWEGIKNVGDWLWDKVSGFFDGVWGKIKNFFGIHSPSKLFKDQLGKNLMLGFAEGIDDYGKYGVTAVGDWADAISDAADVGSVGGVDEFGTAAAQAGSARGRWQIVQNIYAYEMSPAEAYDAAQQAADTATFLGLA